MMRTIVQRNARMLAAGVLLAGSLACNPGYAQTGASSGGAAGGGQTAGGNQGAAPMNPYSQLSGALNGQSGASVTIPAVQPSPDGTSTLSPLASNVFYPDVKTYVLVAEDLINVRLFEAPEYGTTVRLSNDGTADLPLIGSIALAGLTIEKAQDAINSKLKSDGMYRDPHVTLTLGEFDTSQSSVVVAGELHGQFPLRRLHTLGEVLAAAGGLPITGSPVVSIIRPGVSEPILVDLGSGAKDLAKANFPLQAHDTIFIQRLGAVYAVGAFKYTGVMPMQPGRTTLLQIAALTGGPLFAANANDMRIIRTIGTERTEVKVNIDKVLHGKDPDPIMQAGDIVYLPPSAIKNAISSGGLSVLLGAVNIAIYAALR